MRRFISFNLITKDKFLKTSAFYFVISTLNILIPLITLPIITRSVTLDEFGNYSLFKVIFAFSTPLVGLALSSGVLKRYYSLEIDEFKEYVLNSFLPIFVILIIMIFMVFGLRSIIVSFLKLKDVKLVIYALLSGAVVSLYNITLTVFRARNQLKQYFIISLSFICIYIINLVVLFYLHKVTVDYVIYDFIFSYFFGWIVGIIYLFKESLIGGRFKWLYIKDLLNYSFPIATYSLIALAYALNDRIIINSYLSKEELAIYSGTAQVAFIISLIGRSVQLAWTPFSFGQYKKQGINSQEVKKYTKYVIILLIVLSLIFVILFPIIFKMFLPASYSSGLTFYYFFILASLFQSLYWLYNPKILYLEKNKYLILISSVSAVVSIALNYIFVKYGIFYIALIFCLTWLIQLILLLIITSHVKNVEENKAIIY